MVVAEHNTKDNNNLVYILSLTGSIILLSILFIIYIIEIDLSNHVHYTNCYQPVSDYSAEFGKSSDSILYTCGSDGLQKCSRKATSLADAAFYAKSNNAYKFSYNEQTKNCYLLDYTKTNYQNNIYTTIYTTNTRMYYQNSTNGTERGVIKPSTNLGTPGKVITNTSLVPEYYNTT
jgi:hypothetical protein